MEVMIMATIDLKLKSYDELQFEIMRLITDNHLKQQQIDQLTNNWNELEEWLEENKKICKENDNNIGVNFINIVLEKMKEIKNGGNNELLNRMKLLNNIFNKTYKCDCYFSFNEDNITIKVISYNGYFNWLFQINENNFVIDYIIDKFEKEALDYCFDRKDYN